MATIEKPATIPDSTAAGVKLALDAAHPAIGFF